MRGTLSSRYCCHSLLNTDSKIYAGHFRMYGTVVMCILLIVSRKIDVEGEWRNHFVFTCMKLASNLQVNRVSSKVRFSGIPQCSCIVQIIPAGSPVAGQMFQLICSEMIIEGNPSTTMNLRWNITSGIFGSNILLTGGNITFNPLLTSNGGQYICEVLPFSPMVMPYLWIVSVQSKSMQAFTSHSKICLLSSTTVGFDLLNATTSSSE